MRSLKVALRNRIEFESAAVDQIIVRVLGCVFRLDHEGFRFWSFGLLLCNKKWRIHDYPSCGKILPYRNFFEYPDWLGWKAFYEHPMIFDGLGNGQ